MVCRKLSPPLLFPDCSSVASKPYIGTSLYRKSGNLLVDSQKGNPLTRIALPGPNSHAATPCQGPDIIIMKGMRTVFEAAGGNEGLQRLAEAWHRRVMADEVVSHAFSHGFHPQHVERLAAYWAEALGGPSTYSDSYGDETSVVRMHSGNGGHDEMDCRAITCFDQALVDVGLADDSALRQVLHDYFARATTTTMSRYHHSADDVPSGLNIPHWSWDGLQE